MKLDSSLVTPRVQLEHAMAVVSSLATTQVCMEPSSGVAPASSLVSFPTGAGGVRRGLSDPLVESKIGSCNFPHRAALKSGETCCAQSSFATSGCRGCALVSVTLSRKQPQQASQNPLGQHQVPIPLWQRRREVPMVPATEPLAHRRARESLRRLLHATFAPLRSAADAHALLWHLALSCRRGAQLCPVHAAMKQCPTSGVPDGRALAQIRGSAWGPEWPESRTGRARDRSRACSK